MKVLILSSNNGGGHNAVAQALKECFEAHGAVCTVRDCLSFLSENLSEVVSRSHDFMYRHAPKLFDKGYRRGEEHTDMFKEKHRARQMIELGKQGLGSFIRDEEYDAVICTHVFAAMMLTAAKTEYSLSVRTAIVETDYTNTPGCADNEVDFHFVPDESLIPGRVAAGVSETRIMASGIPVRSEICARTEKSEAKQHYGLNPAHRHLLVMGGSMGCGPIEDLVDMLYILLDEDVEISVVCGTNEALFEQMSKKLSHLENVHILGYTQEISRLMDSADLLLTKPGGVTVTEAAVKGLPMGLINVVAGCEAHNLQFFLSNGGAVTGVSEEELCDRCKALLEDQAALRSMAEALAAVRGRDAAEEIYERVRELVIIPKENQIEELEPVRAKQSVPRVQSPLRHQILEMPKAIYEASGIVINGRRIKSLVFTTDLAIIRNCDADAVFAVYPFTPQQAISDAIIKAAYIPVFCGVGGGTTKGLRTIGLAKDVESQGAMGIVLNAPISDLNLAAVARAVDIPVIITVVNMDTDIERRLVGGASILNVAGGAQTPEIVAKIRKDFPDVPIIASGGKTDESIRATIQAGANAITYTPPTAQELFKITMAKYREM